MSIERRQQPQLRVGGSDRRVERIVISVVLVVAALLSAASLAADPTSALTLSMAALYGAVGTLLAMRRPRNPIGWLFLGVLLIFTVTSAADALGGTAVRGGAPLPGGLELVLIWLDTWAFAALFGIYYALTIVFPSGHLPTGPLGRFVRISFLVPLGAVLAAGFGPHLAGNFGPNYIGRALENPAALFPLPDGLDGLFEIATIGLVISGVVSMLVRLRRARGIEREQLKWLVASLALTGALLVVVVSIVVAVPRVGTAIWILAVLGYATVPPAVGVAVLRYRLFEIDRIVSRTVGWAVVSTVLGTVFACAILVSDVLLTSVASSSSLAIALSTLVVAALAQPLRRRVQRRVDKRFNRARYDAERIVASFGSRLRDEVELDQLRADIGAAVALTVQPTSFAVWLRE